MSVFEILLPSAISCSACPTQPISQSWKIQVLSSQPKTSHSVKLCRPRHVCMAVCAARIFLSPAYISSSTLMSNRGSRSQRRRDGGKNQVTLTRRPPWRHCSRAHAHDMHSCVAAAPILTQSLKKTCPGFRELSKILP